MTEANGNVKQGDFHRELKELRADITKILVSLERYHGEVTSAATDRSSIKDALKEMTGWKESTDERLDVIESKDKRYVANVAGIATTVSAVVTGVVALLINYFS